MFAIGRLVSIGAPSSSLSPAQARISSFLGAASSSYDVLDAYSVRYPARNVEAHFGLIRDRLTGEIEKVAFDDGGTPTSGAEMQFKDATDRRTRHGALGERLHSALFGSGGSPSTGQSFEVVVAYRGMDAPKPAQAWDSRSTATDQEALLTQRRLEMAKANAPIRATVVGLLSSLGGVVTEAPAEAPVVYAKVPGASLALFSDGRYSPDVLSVDLPDPAAPRTNIEEFYDSDDMKAKEAFLDNGWHGNGIKVGLHEHVDGCGLWRPQTARDRLFPGRSRTGQDSG